MITFARRVACKYFSLELAKILHAVAAWSDITGVAVTVVHVHEDNLRATAEEAGHVRVELQTRDEQPRERSALAHYLDGALGATYTIEVKAGRVTIEWFPPAYTPH